MTAIVIATFDDEGPFLRARTRAHAAERRILGEWLPYASDALPAGKGAAGIVAVAAIVGLIGAAALFGLQAWTAGTAYPHDVGGRPFFSWQAFLVSPVEFGALAAAIGGTVAFGMRAGLTRLHHPAFDFGEVLEVSAGVFALAIACDPGDDSNVVVALLAEAGAAHSRLVAP